MLILFAMYVSFYMVFCNLLQVAAFLNEDSKTAMPIYDLPYKILCKVVHVQLKVCHIQGIVCLFYLFGMMCVNYMV
jgi:hypothetical protein